MLIFRSIAIGLLGACFLLLATRPTEVRIERVPVFQPMTATTSAATIIDVAGGVPAWQLTQLVRLQPDERVTEVDDQPVANNLDAGAVLAAGQPIARRFVDLTITRGTGAERRVLVLLH